MNKHKNIVSYTSKIPGWLSYSESVFLTQASSILSNTKGEVVEIGSFHGKSTIYLASSNKIVYAIDPHLGNLDNKKVNPSYTALNNNLKYLNLSSRVKILKKTSESANKTWNSPIKLLFIDGLHDQKNASLDYELWSPWLVNNAIIAFHDAFCGWEGAGIVAINKLNNSKKYKEIGVVGSIIYAIKGSPNFLEKINFIRSIVFIKLATHLNNHLKDSPLKFFLIHRIIKTLLLNRFTLKKLLSSI